jgi:hypothetical protein
MSTLPSQIPLVLQASAPSLWSKDGRVNALESIENNYLLFEAIVTTTL